MYSFNFSDNFVIDDLKPNVKPFLVSISFLNRNICYRLEYDTLPVKLKVLRLKGVYFY